RPLLRDRDEALRREGRCGPRHEGADRGVRRRARCRRGPRRLCRPRLGSRPCRPAQGAERKPHVRDHPFRPRRIALQPAGDLADLRIRGRVLLQGRIYRARLRRHHLALTAQSKPHSGEETDMAAKFDLSDDSVVVIVGSGAGGGTLGNELAQKGVKVVALEAGKRYEYEDFINDEWASFTQLAWKDMRTTSGSWRVHKDFPHLPAWIVK